MPACSKSYKKFLFVLPQLEVQCCTTHVNKGEAKCTLLIVQHLISAAVLFTTLIANVCS